MTITEFHKIWKNEIETFIEDNIKIEYVLIHPFGDEEDLLNKLKINPIDCQYVGSYIKLKQKLYFVEFLTIEKLNPQFKEGIYFSKRNNLIYSKYLIKEEYLKRIVVKNWVSKVLNNFNKLEQEKLKEKYIKLI